MSAIDAAGGAGGAAHGDDGLIPMEPRLDFIEDVGADTPAQHDHAVSAGPRQLVLLPSLTALMWPLSDQERRDLEDDLLDHGVREPLVAWKGHDILLDGHQRYSIAQQHNLPFKTVEYEFDDETAAADWIDGNQLARRNLTPEQISLLRGRIYERQKGAPGHRKTVGATVAPTGSLADEMANQHGVSRRTILADRAFALSVEAVKTIEPDIERRLTEKNRRPTRKAIRQAAGLVGKNPEKARKILEGGRPARQDATSKRSRDIGVEPALEKGIRVFLQTVANLEDLDLLPLRGREDLAKRLLDVATRVRGVASRLNAPLE